MEQIVEWSTFDTYLSWIEAISTLCKNLDRVCSKLDKNFPSERNQDDFGCLRKISKFYLGSRDQKESGILDSNHENITDYAESNLAYSPTESTDPNFNGLRSRILKNIRPKGMIIKGKANDALKDAFKGQELQSHGITIKGLRGNKILNKKAECLYNIESDIIKKMNVGDKICVVKKKTGRDNMTLIKKTLEYDYLLDLPFIVQPNNSLEKHHLHSNVPGVYWDKRSWIASWYQGGKRHYRSFSSKLHGFHRAKYFAIQTRLSCHPILCLRRSKRKKTFKIEIRRKRMCTSISVNPKWLDLCVPPTLLRLDLLLTTGQAFSWKTLGNRHWVGVIGSSVYEIKQNDETTLYRTIYGKCSREKLWDYFDLNHEYPEDFSKLPKSVRTIFETNKGVRILQQDPFECLISFICSSNNNIGRITKMIQSLKSNFGTFLLNYKFNNELMEFHSFPSIDQLNKVTPEFLRKLGFGYRSDFIFKTIKILKRKGVDWLYSLKGEDSDFGRTELTTLPGVGRKVADCILLFGLGKRDVVPVDVHIRKIAESHLGLKPGKTLSDSEYNRIGQAFKKIAGDNAGWAQAVLFINSLPKV